MTRVIEWLISLLIVVALFVVIALFLPASREVSHSVETNRPMSTVTDVLTSFTRFRDWNALVNHDSNLQMDVTGPESGEGAKLAFRSNDPGLGQGSWTLTEFVPGERIVYDLETNARGENKTMTFTFERTGQRKQNVRITQTYHVDYGWDLIGRYAGMYVVDNIGEDMKLGLGKFSNLMATIPRFDYSQHEPPFAFVDMPAENVLVASATANRANDDIAVAMTNQLKWIEQVMEENELEASGPMRIVTTEFGADSYTFDVVMPIRPEGTGPEGEEAATDEEEATDEEATAEAAEGEEAADAADAEPRIAEIAQETVSLDAPFEASAMPERLEVEINPGRNNTVNPVMYVQIPAHRAATTTYVGPAPALPRVRDLVRAWAMVRGTDTTARPYDDYRVEIEDMLLEDAEFQVYWPVEVDGESPGEWVQLVPEPVEETDEEAASPDESGEEGEEAGDEDAPADEETGSAE